MDNKVIGCKGIHHVALHCSDFEKSYRFYTEGLGFRLFRRWKSGERTVALLDVGGDVYIELFSNGKERTCFEEQSGQYVHLALSVADTRAAFERAVTCGARVRTEPKDVDIQSDPVLPVSISFVYGPDGEVIEFFEVR